MSRIFVICSFVASVFLVSCGKVVNNRLPGAIGNITEMLVVMPDHLWSGRHGDSIRALFSEPVWGLPALEPMFTLRHQSSLTRLMQKHRSIVIVNLDPELQRSNLRVRHNVHSSHQVIFNIDAPSADSTVSNIYRNRDVISSLILAKGREALIHDYSKIIDKPITERLREKFNVDIVIPRNYTFNDERENFVYLLREQGERLWGILLWDEPYVSIGQLETDSLLIKMNAMTERYVPGEREGSFLATERTVPPFVRRFEKNGVYTVQMNGLWQLENGFMGGPYVSQTIVDINRARLITGVGFVYFPNREKLEMIRQLEAILHSMTPIN